MTDLTANARKVLERRYLQRDETGRLLETPDDMFARVAAAVAAAEDAFDPGARAGWEAAFLRAMRDLEFLPNSPTLMNAGTPDGQLSACFVIPVAPSPEGLLDAVEAAALVQRSGGGTGFSLSALPPGEAGEGPGPVRVLHVLDALTQTVSARGRRRGANMGILRADHPDIREFVESKRLPGTLEGFNISVGAPDAFLEAVLRDGPWDLRDPRSGTAVETVRARRLWQEIVRSAWLCGDPGMVFLDAIEAANPTPALGPIEATNPCGEVPLLPWESCNLGSIQLARLVRARGGAPAFDFEGLRRLARLATRFLDDVIEVNRYPLPAIAAAARRTRKIGVGVMGLAEALARLGLPYASEAALALAREVARVLEEATREASLELARERGPFPAYEGSRPSARGWRVRNATRLSIAPTGTISILAGTSSGIEPLFALAYRRTHVLDGVTLAEVDPTFRAWLAEQGAADPDLLRGVLEEGRLPGGPAVPREARRLFATALEIPPEVHLAMQEAFQRHVDNAVSKTVNLPEGATEGDVSGVFLRAWELRLKGVALFRYGCRRSPALALGVPAAGAEAVEAVTPGAAPRPS